MTETENGESRSPSAPKSVAPWACATTTDAAPQPSFAVIVASEQEQQEEWKQLQAFQDTDEQELQRAIRASLEEVSLSEEAEQQAIDETLTKNQTHTSTGTETALSPEELQVIEQAIREADETEAAKSLTLALELQDEEDAKATVGTSSSQGNVRVLTRGQVWQEQQQRRATNTNTRNGDEEDQETTAAGFRINAASPMAWSRVDRDTIVGPDQELRTKHDVELQAQANAYRLGLDNGAAVGNQAYNAFQQSLAKKQGNKHK